MAIMWVKKALKSMKNVCWSMDIKVYSGCLWQLEYARLELELSHAKVKEKRRWLLQALGTFRV